jgi:hypothetical protein
MDTSKEIKMDISKEIEMIDMGAINMCKIKYTYDIFCEKFSAEYEYLQYLKISEFNMIIDEELNDSEWNLLDLVIIYKLTKDNGIFVGILTRYRPLLKVVISKNSIDFRNYPN